MTISLLILASICVIFLLSSLLRSYVPDNYHSYGKSALSSFIRVVRIALGIDDATDEAVSDLSDSIWLKDVFPERYVLCDGEVTKLIRTDKKNILLGRKYDITVRVNINDNDIEITLSSPVYWKRTDREPDSSDLSGRMFSYDTRTNTCRMVNCENISDAFRLVFLFILCIIAYIIFSVT